MAIQIDETLPETFRTYLPK